MDRKIPFQGTLAECIETLPEGVALHVEATIWAYHPLDRKGQPTKRPIIMFTVTTQVYHYGQEIQRQKRDVDFSRWCKAPKFFDPFDSYLGGSRFQIGISRIPHDASAIFLHLKMTTARS
jgi:hypothetical protein